MTSGGKEDKYNHPIDMDISPRAETNNTSHPQGKCALCGKQIKTESQGPRGDSAGGADKDGFSPITDTVEGTDYEFDSPDCAVMFKRLKSVYGERLT
ncbi:MAG: hypothetical protein WBL68_06165, partial [Nitrososphaeraceae archaeon]